MSREGIWERAYKIFGHRLKHRLPGDKDGDWLRAKWELEQEKNGYTIVLIGSARVRAKLINVQNK